MTEAFDHHNFSLVRRNDHVQIALVELVERWERNEFSIDTTDPYRSDRAEERQGAHKQSGSCTVHTEDIGVVLSVTAQDDRLYLDFVDEAFWEQWTDRSVDQSTGQRFLSGRTPFTLDEPAWELARCSESLTVITGQRKEVGSGT